MVTGIECAGLVLGVFPILITGIQAYSQGMSTITRARKYRSTLRQYSLDLSREYTVFRNTWFRIVQLVEFNSGGHLQNAPELNLQVLKEKPQKAVVGQKIDLKTILSLALQCFDDVGLNDIERTFEELSDLITRVAIDFHITAAVGVEDSMAIPDLVNCNLASASTEAGSKGYKARLKSLQKMLETGLSEGYRNEKLSQIREKNMFLSRLITGDTVAQTFAFVRDFPRSRTPINMGRGLVHTRLYNHIQDQAKSIHRALQRKFEPSTARCCGLGHRGLLQLEVRGISINTPPTAMNLKHVCYRFGLCFSFDRPTTRLGEVDSACELELGIMKEHEDSSGSNPSGDSTPKIVEQIGLAANGKSTEESKSRSNGKGKKGDVNACGNGRPQVGQLPQLSQACTFAPKNSVIDNSKFKTIRHLFGRGGHSSPIDTGTSSTFITQQTSSMNIFITEEAKVEDRKSSRSVCPQIVISHSGSNSLHEQSLSSLSTQTAGLGRCQSCDSPNKQVISSLCGAATAAIQKEKWRQCIGILSNIGEAKVRVCPRGGKQLKVNPMELVTLQALFNRPQKPSIRDRLRLAVLLASSVMQLHETSWLNKLWYSSDIFFKGTDARDLRLAEPYLRSTFQAAQESTFAVAQVEDEWSDCILYCNQTLFMLGIVLIEIYHWERFEALENGRRKSQAVREIVTELFQNAGENYGLSVKTCVQGLPGIEMDLDHEGFKNEVYEKIVVPLEDNLKHFCRTKDLSTIFNSSTLQ